jgi:hypothetical protein
VKERKKKKVNNADVDLEKTNFFYPIPKSPQVRPIIHFDGFLVVNEIFWGWGN